jgi:hypothetical protein
LFFRAASVIIEKSEPDATRFSDVFRRQFQPTRFRKKKR